jgi:hypothetical protein
MTEENKIHECDHNFYRDHILTRVKQESTWRGIVTILTLAGWHISPAHAEIIISIGASLVGAINILKKD